MLVPGHVLITRIIKSSRQLKNGFVLDDKALQSVSGIGAFKVELTNRYKCRTGVIKYSLWNVLPSQVCKIILVIPYPICDN